LKELRFDTPIAFFIFNRPELARLVFNEIAKIKPRILLVISDAPRETHPEDYGRVEASKKIIEEIDWDCNVLTNYSPTNLGCKDRLSSGLDWVFKNVSEAIILEDDCLPSPIFFQFCQDLLGKYRDIKKIGMISGCNFDFEGKDHMYDYYYSKNAHIWGWATWADRWNSYYDVSIKQWPSVKKDRQFKKLFGSKDEFSFWRTQYEKVFRNEIDTWDIQWSFALKLNNLLSIMPNRNLISNIGFGPQATHTKIKSKLASIPFGHLNFPLRSPLKIEASDLKDRRYFLNHEKQNLLSGIREILKIRTRIKMIMKNR